MKNYSFILFFGVWRLQNFRNRHEKRPIYPQNKVGRIPHTVSTRVWPSSKLHTSYNIYIARPYAYAHIDMNSSTSYPHTVFLHIYSKREDAEQRKIMQENYPDIDIFLVHSAQNHALWNTYNTENWWKNGMNRRKMQDDSYTRTKFYTLSFTRNPQCIKGLSRVGVGNVGDFSKTFFIEERRNGFLQDMGNWKHRTSLRQTSVLSRQNIGTFPQRSPMFLVSGRATDICSAGIHHRNF